MAPEVEAQVYHNGRRNGKFRKIAKMFGVKLVSVTTQVMYDIQPQAKKKAPKGLKTRGKPVVLGSAGASEDAQWVRPAETVALTALVTHVPRIEVSIHGIRQRRTHKVLQPVRNVSA